MPLTNDVELSMIPNEKIVEDNVEEAEAKTSALIKSISMSDATQGPAVQGIGRPGWKPQIDHLQNAIDPTTGQFLLKVGDKVLIQYPHPWRDTTVFIIKSIDPSHMEHGFIGLWDPNGMQFTCSSYITGPRRGLMFKIPDSSRNWVPGENEDLYTQVKRKYTRRATEEKPIVVVPTVTDKNGDIVPVKRPRGRPKGSKSKNKST